MMLSRWGRWYIPEHIYVSNGYSQWGMSVKKKCKHASRVVDHHRVQEPNWDRVTDMGQRRVYRVGLCLGVTYKYTTSSIPSASRHWVDSSLVYLFLFPQSSCFSNTWVRSRDLSYNIYLSIRASCRSGSFLLNTLHPLHLLYHLLYSTLSIIGFLIFDTGVCWFFQFPQSAPYISSIPSSGVEWTYLWTFDFPCVTRAASVS